jgi:chemotaxis protein methyltransferase CheR
MTISIAARDVDRFRSAVARRLGLQFDEAKSGFLEQVLRRRVESGDQNCAAYLLGLETEPSKELRELARELTVGETYFFRNNDQFRALAEIALPDRMRGRASQRRLRLLSAGCASGEEAYSLSIIAKQTAGPLWDVSILGVDVNPAILERAQRAKFSSWALRETAPDVERRWFRGEGRESVLEDEARVGVRFEERNLIEDDLRLWEPEAYDVIFCRNVIMYFTAEKAQAVIDRIARSLAPGGYLFLGHAETLRGLSGQFHLRHTHETFYYQRRERLDEPGAESPVAIGALSPSAPLAPLVEGASTWVEAIRRASERIDALATSSRDAVGAVRTTPSQRPELGEALDLLERERYAEALESVSALPAGARNDPDALLLHAVLLVHRGRLAEAEGTCERLLAIDELNAGAHYALALCREGCGDGQGALDHDQVAVYLDRSFAMPRLHLGLVARKRGDLETARRELGQALVLLQREDAARLLLFGGGFGREALLGLCRAELASCGGHP